MPNDPVMAGAIKTHVSSGSRRIRSTTNSFERSLICAIDSSCMANIKFFATQNGRFCLHL